MPERLLLDGAEFPVVRDVDAFMAAVPDQLRIAVALDTLLEYEDVYVALMNAFDARYDSASLEQRAFVHAELVCLGCGWAFPGSYTAALLGMIGDNTWVAGGTEGFREFGETGVCTRCRADWSALAYERFAPSDIGPDDVAALRQYWRDLAIAWWATSGTQQGLCDVCGNRTMGDGEGYLTSGSYLTCDDCVRSRLDGAVEKLRESPYYYGSHELRRARDHVSKR